MKVTRGGKVKKTPPHFRVEKMLFFFLSTKNNPSDQVGTRLQLSNTAGLGAFHMHRCCAGTPRSRQPLGANAVEPLVTPSLYGAVLRKGLKSRFGAPTLLPQRDSCNLLSHTPILPAASAKPSHGRPDSLLIQRKQQAARSGGGNGHTPESATERGSL